jgi:hypothetical protein
MYTEIVYYDEAGDAVERLRMNDDSLYDSSGPYSLNESELSDYFPEVGTD